MATRKKSVNDIEAQLQRIKDAVSRRAKGQPDEIAIPLYKRYRRALRAATAYQKNIFKMKSQKNYDRKFEEADNARDLNDIARKQMNRKYSPNTYRGLNKG